MKCYQLIGKVFWKSIICKHFINVLETLSNVLTTFQKHCQTNVIKHFLSEHWKMSWKCYVFAGILHVHTDNLLSKTCWTITSVMHPGYDLFASWYIMVLTQLHCPELMKWLLPLGDIFLLISSPFYVASCSGCLFIPLMSFISPGFDDLSILPLINFILIKAYHFDLDSLLISTCPRVTCI